MAEKKYFQEHVDYLREITPGRRDAEIRDLFNARFNLGATLDAIKSLRLKHGIRITLPRVERKYTDEQIDYLRELTNRGLFNYEITEEFNRRFGTSKTRAAIAGRCFKCGLKTSARNYFKKGHKPWNKGLKGLQIGGKKTQFKPGNIPHTWVPVGSERITREGYLQIKIQDGKKQRNWKGKHIIVWEEHHGTKVPPGHVIIFGDGDKRNFDPDNLILVSRAQLAVLNKYGLIQGRADLTRTGLLITDVIRKAAKKAREKRT